MNNKLSKLFTYNLICPKCGKSFKKEIKEYKFRNSNGKFYCSRTCANSRKHTDSTKLKIANSVKEFAIKNGYKEPEEKFCKLCGIKLCKTNKSNLCHNCLWKPEERRKFLSQRLKGSGAGGYRENAAKGLRGKYHGIHCDSTWELVYLVYQLDHGIEIIRNTDGFEYEFENEKHIYYPDFKVGDTYIEIKGREYPKWKYKIEQFPKDKKLIVLYKNDLKDYFRYVKNKYGRNFTSLYDHTKELIDYNRFHWYTNTITGEYKYHKGKLEFPFVLGRIKK